MHCRISSWLHFCTCFYILIEDQFFLLTIFILNRSRIISFRVGHHWYQQRGSGGRRHWPAHAALLSLWGYGESGQPNRVHRQNGLHQCLRKRAQVSTATQKNTPSFAWINQAIYRYSCINAVKSVFSTTKFSETLSNFTDRDPLLDFFKMTAIRTRLSTWNTVQRWR